ncbi:MAG: head maturation protease, ClpP-related [Filifactoraceae bacterium]
MKIDVKGPIIDNDDQWIYDWFGVEATSPKKVTDAIANAEPDEELEIEINSGGGSVFSGSEIYTALKSYAGNVIVKVVGIAASAATVIAMGGKKILMSPTSQFMIHNASGCFGGDYRDMQKGTEILKNVNSTISNAYRLKTGLENEELLEMMNKETWLTPQQALDKGFIDEIMFTDDIKLTASLNNGMLPQEVINKMRLELKNNIEPENNIEAEKKSLLEDLDFFGI